MPLSVPQNSSLAGPSLLASNTKKETSPAFQGASRAFNANAAASAASFTGANGAFAAGAASVGGGRGQQQASNEGPLSISRQNTGQSIPSRDVSPSHLAANLAASQASSRLSQSQGVRRPSPLQRMPTGSTIADQQNGDLPSSPATKSLVQLYESKQTPGLQKTQSVRYVSKPGPPIRSPKPVRPITRPHSSSGMISDQSQLLMNSNAPQRLIDGFDGSPAVSKIARSNPTVPINQTTMDTQEPTDKKREPPQAPPPRRKQYNTEAKSSDGLEPGSRRIKSSVDLTAPRNLASPEASQSPKAMSSVFPHRQNSSDTQPPPSSNRSSNPLPNPLRSTPNLSKPPPQPIARQTSKDSAQSLSSHMSIDSLATAMVASSLASSRNPSPTKSLPPLPPPRRHHSLFHHHHSRTPSPQKSMRHTMRKHHSTSSDSDSGSKRGHHHHLVRKHQHKHHEGDRKRYRTQVTERERKRYEGVWAANKGLLLPPSLTPSTSATSLDPSFTTLPPPRPEAATNRSPTPTVYSHHPSNTVLNIVARDIYRRSRLPDDVLAEVWDLATSFSPTADRLGREEFVVGMWLIDQRLRGNKLPVRVSESVWASVRRLPGITVGGKR